MFTYEELWLYELLWLMIQIHVFRCQPGTMYAHLTLDTLKAHYTHSKRSVQ